MHLYIYTHIFPLSVGGKGWSKGRGCQKGSVGEEEMEKGIVTVRIISSFFYLDLTSLSGS